MSSSDSENSTIFIDETQTINPSKLAEGFRIQFMFGQKIIEVNDISEFPLVFGRDESKCAFTVQDQVVSRQHCKVNIEDGRLTVTDSSTNGTYIRFGHAEEIYLERGDSYPLTGRGMIKLGNSFAKDEKGIIYFKCL